MVSGPRVKFLESLDFNLDPFQEQSLDLFDAGESVLVASPTGSGKTLVGLYAIAKTLHDGAKAFYTTPLKALSNQKYLEFCAYFGTESVGLLTGDNSIRPGASVVVMTTEVLRNMIYADSPELSNLGLVVLDEVHYLQNPYRGAVWEEVIIHLPPSVALVCLSATVSNAEEFATWMKTVRGSMEAVIEERRPVELDHLYLYGDRRTNSVVAMNTFDDGRPNPEGPLLNPPWLSTAGPRRHSRLRAFQARRTQVVDYLSEASMLPAIYFIFSRAACEDAAREAVNSGIRLTSIPERKEIRALVDERLAHLSARDLEALGFRSWMLALEAGFAPHHAGMVPPFREIVEACFERALVKVVFATETLSLGINMPARSVVLEKLSKYNGERHELLSPGEYTQLSGRAGRRGIDNLGYCVVLWNPAVPFEHVSSLASTRSYPITSSFRPTYNMATNLIKRHEPEIARHLLNLSFAQFRSDSEVVELEAELGRARKRVDEARLQVECELGDVEEFLVLNVAKREAKASPPKSKRERSLRLESLRVGNIVVLRDPEPSLRSVKLAVVSVGMRSRGRVKVTAVSTSGKAYLLSMALEDRVELRGSISLPRPYLPTERPFRVEVARLLKEFDSPGDEEGEPKLAKGREEIPATVVDVALKELEDRLKLCPSFSEHLQAVKRKRRLGTRVAELASRIRAKLESLALQLDRVLEVLEKFGYIEGWSLTEKGDRLSKIYSEGDLLCSLALEEGVFDGLDPASFASVISCLTFDIRPQYRTISDPPTKLIGRRARMLKSLWKGLTDLEADQRIPLTREPDIGFTELIYKWAQGADLADVLMTSQVPPGDFVRCAKQVVDLLRQLSQVAPLSHTREAAGEAIDAVLRGVVAASSEIVVPGEVPDPQTPLSEVQVS